MRIGQALNPPTADTSEVPAMSEVPALPEEDLAGGSAPVMQPPESLKATGLSPTGVTDLVLKHLMRSGDITIAELSALVALPLPIIDALLAFLRSERLVEIPRRGSFDGDVRYVLTDAGRVRVADAMRRNQYVGPAPVSLADYVACVQRQGVLEASVSRLTLETAIRNLVLPPELVVSIGAALNSHRPIFLYGPSGAGKTFLAEHLLDVVEGVVWVPHAIEIDGEIVQVFDPMVHRKIEAARPAGSLDRARQPDARWVLCQRPVVKVGGELTLEMMDLELDPVTRFYKAPLQLKANNGMLLLDDLGRQRIAPRELLNRWIVPLDRRVDYLSLHTGVSFQVPFDVMVIFSSNHSPTSLDDPAFVRRLGYKIRLDALDEAGYRRVLRQACERVDIEYEPAAADYVIDVLHRESGMPLMPAYPFDLVQKIRDRADYFEDQPKLTPEVLRWAWDLYFAAESAADCFEPNAVRTMALNTGGRE
jgi:MoxR-like ATPase